MHCSPICILHAVCIHELNYTGNPPHPPSILLLLLLSINENFCKSGILLMSSRVELHSPGWNDIIQWQLHVLQRHSPGHDTTKLIPILISGGDMLQGELILLWNSHFSPPPPLHLHVRRTFIITTSLFLLLLLLCCCGYAMAEWASASTQRTNERTNSTADKYG